MSVHASGHVPEHHRRSPQILSGLPRWQHDRYIRLSVPFREPEYPGGPDPPRNDCRSGQIQSPPHQRPEGHRTGHKALSPSLRRKRHTSACRPPPVKAVPPAHSSVCHDTFQRPLPGP